MLRSLLVIIVVALAAAPAASASIRPLEGSDLEAFTTMGDGPAVFDFAVRFELDRSRWVYLTVLDAPGNPVYQNGTPGGDGWWAEASLEGNGGVTTYPPTNGTERTWLGHLPDDIPMTLRLRIHAPAEAVRVPVHWALAFALESEAPNIVFFGSGDTPLTFTPHIAVVEPATIDHTATVPSGWGAGQITMVVAAGLAALGLATKFRIKP